MSRSSWLAWALLAVTLGLFAAGQVLLIGAGVALPAALGPSFLLYSAIGTLIAARRPKNPVGWIFCVLGLSWQVAQFAAGLTAYLRTAMPSWTPDAVLWLPMNFWLLGTGLFVIALVLFPDGRLASALDRSALWFAVAATAFGVLAGSASAGTISTHSPVVDLFPPEYRVQGGDLLGVSVTLATAAAALLAAVCLALRFRRAHGVERQQLKWFAYAGLGTVTWTLALSLGVAYWPPLRALDPGARFAGEFLQGIPVSLAFAAIPVATAIAILRYRLYDIDLLINRTLVYGAVTATLIATYAATVILLRQLLPFTAGNDIAIAASTLLIAALFQPLRQRVQNAVDRHFYRRTYDAAKTVDAFAARLRQEVNLDMIGDELLGVVRGTIQPDRASIWLRETRP